MKKKQLHKPNWLVTMLLLVMAILMPYEGAWAQTKPTRGDGSVDKPYEISSAAELAWFRDYVNNESQYASQYASATLTEDIDLSEFCHAADAATNTEELSWDPIGKGKMYCGTFDGNGKTIRNLYINSTIMFKGFFGYAIDCRIKNITFDNAKVKNTNTYGTGILAGAFEKCTIENIKILANCSVEGTENTGGIAGAGSGNISNCENRAMVNGTNRVGGIVGNSCDNTISSCANYGAVTGTEYAVGGMVGYFESGTMQNSANYGDISGADLVGNLIGHALTFNLNNVLGVGNVTATNQIGGLIVGESNDPRSTAAGVLAYNNNAKLTINGTEQTGEAVKAIGQGSLTSAFRVKAFSAEQLKSGLVAFLLQGNGSESAKWGQKLNTDDYPLLNSADKVYSDSPITMKWAHPIYLGGIFFYSIENLYLCTMNNQGLLALAQLILPSEILSNFEVVRVEEEASFIRIYLDESIKDEYKENPEIESKGFCEAVTIRDFPIRDKGVDLIVRRRKWYDKQNNRYFSDSYDLKAEGTRYSKEFAAFLKGVYGDDSYDLPFA